MCRVDTGTNASYCYFHLHWRRLPTKTRRKTPQSKCRVSDGGEQVWAKEAEFRYESTKETGQKGVIPRFLLSDHHLPDSPWESQSECFRKKCSFSVKSFWRVIISTLSSLSLSATLIFFCQISKHCNVFFLDPQFFWNMARNYSVSQFLWTTRFQIHSYRLFFVLVSYLSDSRLRFTAN